MKKILKLFCLIILSYFWLNTLYAQETVPATGGMASGSGGTVSYSVGQVTWNTISGTNGSAAQGVQQPYEISVVTSIYDLGEVTLEYSVFPNPTKGLIKLLVESTDLKNFSYQLTDMNGRLIQVKKVATRETEISMENLTPAVYFVRLMKKDNVIKIFKIVKN